MGANIIVSIDFSDTTEFVIAEAKKLAGALAAKIWIIHVPIVRPDLLGYETGPVYFRGHVAETLQREHHMLQDFQNSLRSEGFDVEAMLLPGSPAEKILEKAQSIRPDFIVLGSHGHGAMCHLLAGSVCEDIIKHVDCPVVVVPVKKAKEAHLRSTSGVV